MSDITQEQVDGLIRKLGYITPLTVVDVETVEKTIEALTERQQHIKRIEELEGAVKQAMGGETGVPKMLSYYTNGRQERAVNPIYTRLEQALSTNEDKGE
tara:strand:+ start:16 stop:315 length:300 start_codon:yes stop_codon:yes gene_type:complete